MGNSKQQTLKGRGTSAPSDPRTTLVLYHRDGAAVVHLERDRPIVVGRSAPADLVIPDPNLSRQHARFTWDDAGLHAEDLGRTNGTKKNGKLIKKRTTITARDDIAVGPVIVSIHAAAVLDEELRDFDGHDRFLVSLGEELIRARMFQRPLAVVLVRAVAAASAANHVSRWAERLRVLLRPVDRVGVYGPAAVLVALPEASPEAVRAFAQELAGGDPALACAVATFPADGASVEELIAALHAARRTDRKGAGETATIIESKAMKEVLATVRRVAPSTIALLLHGETGTGKEVIARAIHEAGPRKKQPLCSINCAALPATLLESALFGHEQGAFTGADRAARGIFEQADGGTVMLDEVGELSPSAQAALLRVLETKQLMRVGGDKQITVDVRVIAATHRDLEAMVSAGRFRQDLLYRLDQLTIRIPPLRERIDDIRPLAEKFLAEACRQAGVSRKHLADEALAALERYAWPGNVRELRNAIERAVVLADASTITVAELTDRIRGAVRAEVPAAAEAAPALAADLKESVRRYEIDLIVNALATAGGNQTAAAKALGLPLRTLVHKIHTYGIQKKFTGRPR
ncbi:MAG: sigma 54-interacting transcriptional regulator [Myxococcales bacterium]|nr:sigma 54-interacting transcriptional regulator [Myxococcales bacterium]